MRLYLNLGTADARRQNVECHFLEHSLDVHRQAAVPAHWLRDARGYTEPGRRARALSKRLALRRAMLAGVSAMFFFEDDVELHPEWRQRLTQIELPEDWGMFMLGALHEAPPVVIAPGLVRCTHAADHHAIGFRATCFHEIRVLLRGRAGPPDPKPGRFSDQRVAEVQNRIPTYAAWPNLAWQSGADAHTNYHPDGRQRTAAEQVKDVDETMSKLFGYDAGHRERRSTALEISAQVPERPWMHEKEVVAITSRLRPEMTMLEYGSGGSTAVFSRMVARYCSVEHDPAWHGKLMAEGLSVGVTLLLRPPAWPQRNTFDAALPGQFTDYLNAWREFGVPFDAVLIDGRARVDAALSVAEGLRAGGLLFFHDFFSRERYWKRLPELEQHYRLVDAVRDTEQSLAIFERR